MKKYRKWILLIIVLLLVILSIPEIFHQNNGKSKSIGSVRDGKLKNAYLIPYSGKNYSYFSPLSYFIMNNGYTHSKVYKTVLDAYKECEESCKGTTFKIMECSDKNGGKMLIHRTHQNGTSVDFMVPKKNDNKPFKLYDYLGMWHYLLGFTDAGKLKFHKSVEIDFEAIGKHILALDNAAQKNGLKIRKIILKIELKDELYNTKSGKEIKRRGIYIVRNLPHIINIVHDDHYHVDFI